MASFLSYHDFKSYHKKLVNLPYLFIGPVKQIKKQRKIVIIYLSISLNMCFGCSKEQSH